ncbi:MAG: metal-dependent transcriptional regulator [Oscillospiraceae bacterium]|jgi:Mn-dependent DtxR family transcriptional regulator|nr:metal-dependent transcriptional regulator [Oscillospiraceae bacterium]
MHASAEDYLEAILELSAHGAVRAVDVAAHLGFSRASVSVAMKKLREAGLVVPDEDGALRLTEGGHALAAQVLERHNVLRDWLIGLGVPENIAAEDACRMEHILSFESFEAIQKSAGAA